MAPLASQFPSLLETTAWVPAVDIYRNDLGWLFKFDLAGVRALDVTVELTSEGLWVSGRRCDMVADPSYRREHLEIAYSRFERFIELPAGACGISFSTELKDGMLYVLVPAAEAHHGR